MKNILEMRKYLEQCKGNRNQLVREKKLLEEERKKLRRILINCNQAAVILMEAAKLTQNEVRTHFSEIVSLALKSIYENPYEFDLKFKDRGNKTVLMPMFKRGGKEYIPGKGTGGGPVDISALAIRIAVWNIMRCRGTIILDEPFSYLDGDAIGRLGEFLRFLSKEMGIQFIIVSHNEDLIGIGDKVFRVSKIRGKSKVFDKGEK